MFIHLFGTLGLKLDAMKYVALLLASWAIIAGCSSTSSLTASLDIIMAKEMGRTALEVATDLGQAPNYIYTYDSGGKVLIYWVQNDSKTLLWCYFISPDNICVNWEWWLLNNSQDNNYSEFYSDDEYVQGYYRSDGTYVQGYYRTRADNTTENNYSHKGNINPYTGQEGYKQ